MDRTTKPLDPADVTVHRRGRGKPVVLLHCLGMDWHFWDVLEPLAAEFELIAYSLPGHHDTKLPAGPYGEAELTEQLRALLKREGVDKAHLAGISMGGSLAQHFAGTGPLQVAPIHLVERVACDGRGCDGLVEGQRRGFCFERTLSGTGHRSLSQTDHIARNREDVPQMSVAQDGTSAKCQVTSLVAAPCR